VASVDPIQPQGDEAVDLPGVLGVTAEAAEAEAAEEGNQTSGPVLFRQLHSMYGHARKVRRHPLGSFVDPLDSGGVDQGDVTVGFPDVGEDTPVGVAQPERTHDPVPTGHLQYRLDRSALPDIQGEGNAGIYSPAEVLQRGDGVRKPFP